VLMPWLDPSDLTQARVALPWIASLLVALAAVKGLAHLGQAVLIDGTSERVAHDLRVRLYDHLMRLPLERHRHLALGDMMARLLSDIQRVRDASIGAYLMLLREALSAVALVGVAVWMAPRLALAAALAIPVVGLVVSFLYQAVKRAAGRGQEHVGQAVSRAAQGLVAIREVKSCGAEEREVEAFAEQSRLSMRWVVRQITIRALSPMFNEVLASLALGATLVYAGSSIAQGALAPERFISFFVAVVLMYRPIKAMSVAFQLAASGGASMDRVSSLLSHPTERRARGEGLSPLKERFELQGIGFAYQDGRPEHRSVYRTEPGASPEQAPARSEEGAYRAICDRRATPPETLRGVHGDAECKRFGARALDGVDLCLERGRVKALAGPSGAGKTTLANVVSGLDRSDSGRLIWDGEDITSLPLAELRRQVALVPQQPLLLDGSVADNLRYGAPHATVEDLRSALDATGMLERVDRLERGLGTMIGPEGVLLSAGEAQRLAVARALLRRVKLLVLDEPSSALDPQNEAQLVQTLRRAGREQAVLLIAHSTALLSVADEVITMDAGGVVSVDCRDRPTR